MAAYAALTSLMHIVELIRHHPRPPITTDKQQIESLHQIVGFLQNFLENYSHRNIGGFLETQIADAAYAAEDIIESRIVDQILAVSTSHDEGKSSSILFCQDLLKVTEDMNLIKKEAIKIQEKNRGINDDQLPRNNISMSANIGSSTVPPPTRKNTNAMVGFDDVLIEIMERLTGHPPNRQVLPIVGMGGIGKTTLARHAYVEPFIVKHFDIRIWITISQGYRLQDILVKALSSISKTSQIDEHESSKDELGNQLHKSLCGRRYLIILDDVWSIEAWEELMLFFPEYKNGSRIIVTTRISNVADHFGPSGFKMNFLDEDKSWNLLCKIAFPQDQCCPQELEEIGKKIARNCKGLPLSLVVIGGILANSGNTREQWEYVEENLNSVVNLDGNEHCLNILYLSYNDLPIHLKPCFLYMGVFPEDKHIDVTSLIRLWVAEGFLKPIAEKCLEVVAEEYLKDLIDRNLILVDWWHSSGLRMKYCSIHDLLRDLCLREAKKDKFLWTRTVHGLDNLEGIQGQRRISIHEGTSKEDYHIDRFLEALPLASVARSLTCDFKVVLPSHSFKLLRVFNMVDNYTNLYPKAKPRYSLEDVFKLVNSRYLYFEVKWKSTSIFLSSIHLLWNLQTLIIKGCEQHDIDVPPEIWVMSQLRHLEIDWFYLPDPPNVPVIHEGDDDDFILRNLHTLKRVINFELNEKVIKRIPNIKKLQVIYYYFHEGRWHDSCLNNLGLLKKLESLNLDFCFGLESGFQLEFLQNFAFLHSLEKLTLQGTYLLWEDMSMIGSLPLLQELILEKNSFEGPEWNVVEDEFLSLKFLLIKRCYDLVYWNANETHFPCLEHLVLDSLDNLKEIPLDIGQIPTLQSIQIDLCSDSAVMSAKNLLDEQVGLGNEELQVYVLCQNTLLESLATHNFHVELL